MIFDSATELQGRTIDCDVCIVGGGAAGITIAREFVGQRLNVVLLESGGLEFDADDQSLYAGQSIGEPYYDLTATRLRFFGGATNHWAGLCGALARSDFEGREWIRDSGWPLAYEVYRAYLARARTVCEIDDAARSVEELNDLTGGNELQRASARFVPTIKQYSPPTRFGRRYRSELAGAANIRVLLKSNAVDIEAFEHGRAIRSVRARTLAGSEYRVRARCYVLAAGGLENPRLLLLSNGVQKNGLGNDQDLVGRYFHEHPHLKLGALALARKDARVGAFAGEFWRRLPGVRGSLHLVPTVALQRDERLPNFEITPQFEWGEGPPDPSLVHEIGMQLKWRNLIDHRRFLKYFADQRPLREAVVTASVEQEPNPFSRVRLGDERDALGLRRIVLDWRFTDLDRSAPERIARLLAIELGAQGIGRMRIAVETGGHNGLLAGHHHMGTTRMGASARQGVVDTDCRVHGIDNLFVAGSSVFPTGGAMNPTFTIVALAIRLADHLKEALRS